jgi:hypothetical protein
MGSGDGPFGLFGGGDDEAPMVNVTPYNPVPARDEFKPINAMQWMDSITGEEFSFIRDQNGNLNVNINDRSGRERADEPITYNNVNTNLPNVADLPNFNNRYAAAVVNLTNRLRGLQDTIQVMENTAPELIPQNRAVIDAFKQASQRAMDRNFDIRRNGIDKKLASMGLTNSSTALGAEIALARERSDAEILNQLQTAELGQKTKQQSLSNLFNLGNSLVQEGSIELNRYNSESNNELTARQQDLGREQLVQNRASEQARLNLANEQTRINVEQTNRANRLALMGARNPSNTATSLLLNSNNQALGALQGDNSAMYNQTMSQLQHQQVETQRFQANQAAQSNPMGQMLTTGLGVGLGALTGTMGTNLANNLTGSPRGMNQISGMPWLFNNGRN